MATRSGRAVEHSNAVGGEICRIIYIFLPILMAKSWSFLLQDSRMECALCCQSTARSECGVNGLNRLERRRCG